MMRKEDLKKHCKEEKIVLPADRIFKFSLFILLFIFSGISAQVPVNGFCRYREFNIKSGYTGIASVDFNSDGYRDLFIYNSNLNKYITLQSDPNSNFINIAERYLSSPVNDLHAFGNETSGKRYLIDSRGKREVSLALFTRNGSLNFSGRIKFNGSPSKVDAADIDGDGRPEGLVSGTSIDGLYIIKENNRSFRETKINSGRIYSWSSFIDLDYDSFPDIAAVDPISNSIIFFNNNRTGKFFESRSIGFTGEIKNIKCADINSDGFTDIVLANNKRFEILLGDSVSTFNKKMIIDTPVNPDKFEILDFNGDGFNDIAFIDIQKGELYIMFAKNSVSFYPPLLYMKKNSLVNMTSYIDRAGRKLAVLSSDGKLFLINSIGLNDSNFMVSMGTSLKGIQVFDYMNDKYRDISFIDEYSRSLKIFLSERRKLFRTYFSVPLSDAHTEICVDDINPKIKTFYCYSKGKRLIEAVRINLENGKSSKQILYTDYPVEDLNLLSDRLKDWQTLSVLIRNGQQLLLQIIEMRDFKKSASASSSVISDSEQGWINMDIYTDIYSVSHAAGKLELTKLVFNKKIIEKKNIFTLDMKAEDKSNVDLVCINETVGRSKPVGVFVSVNQSSSFYYILNKNYQKYPLKYPLSDKMKPVYSIAEGNEMPSFFYFRKDKNILERIVPDGQTLKSTEFNHVESKDLNNYLVAEINKGRTFLIYLNNANNTLSIEKI